ncbi:3-dehydroquinate synthase [Marinicauda salina]|uniref:3-dehydroquinate synthase n=1 Tax=Marinicauda salina TaxID=2135793 RepID=A0A2U2BS34_9PROT|nr:3-dehydroquinate synthase [Marinicauda salina]PWE16814.1 3-dehydroquinate synthase [Marinicauda salina]
MTGPLRVPVELGDRRYEVLIGPNALEAGADALRALCPRGRALIVADRTAFDRHGARLNAALDEVSLEPVVFEIDGGEAAKSWDQLESLVDSLLDAGIDRTETVIAFGGGTIGDLAGFAASIVKRGVGFAQIPTTLLAQVDSSVGGKTGINVRQGKNLVGAFHQPALVLADTGLLATLPGREVRAGYAEIVKAALIGDAALFDRLEAAGADALDGGALAEAVADAVAFKARIVAEDERERGPRALLNLGHTFAHAFEAEAAPGALVHGEAVACGLALAFRYSARLGACPKADAEQIAAHLEAVGLPARIGDLAGGPFEAERLLARMAGDKKTVGGAITLILARGIGEAYIAPRADARDLAAFLEREIDDHSV